MKMSISALALAAAALLTSVPAMAHEVVYVGTFSGAAEAPPNASAGTGSFTITFDLDLATMRVQATFAGLTGNTTAAHIHCCNALVPPGTGTAGVATMTPSFVGFPLGVKSGSMDQTFDLALASSYNSAFITANDTTPGNALDNVSLAMNALLNGAAAGKAYFNIHTSSVPGGEVRGFLAAAPVPEPGTYALMLGGLALLGVAARRKQA